MVLLPRWFALAGLLIAAAVPAWTNPTYTIDTFAGSDLVGDNGPAVAAQLRNARGIAFDRLGNLFVADTDNHRVRVVTTAGVISTLAGNGHAGFSGDGGPAAQAQLNSPFGLAVDSSGNIYIADFGNQRVRKVAPDGTISTVAGTGDKASGGDGGPAAQAQLASPRNLAIDSAGNIYVSEFEGHRVRRIGRDGRIATVAGTGKAGLNLDPNVASMPASTAQLAYPAGLFVDQYDSLYIADSGNNLVRRVWGGNMVTALDGRSNPAFLLYSPTGIAVDPQGFLYITDSTAVVRKLYAGQLVAAAGTGDVGYAGDGSFATSALLTGPHDLAFDPKGALFIADGCYVRKVAGDKISTVAGNGYAAGIGDGQAASMAQMIAPAGLGLDAAGNLFIADAGMQRIRRVSPQGIVQTVAGNGQAGFAGDNGSATAAELAGPAGVAADSAGNLYFADTHNNRVRKLLYSGILQTAAGIGPAAMAAENQMAALAPLNQPRGVAVDPAGTVFIADTGNHRILRLTKAGTLVTVAGIGSPGYTGDNGLAQMAQLNAPAAIAFDARGNLYIADTFNHAIRMVTPAGNITTVAGSGAAGFSGDDGPAAAATLNFPAGIAVDAAGVMYIADTWNHRIRVVDGAGAIRTIAGAGTPGFAGDGGGALDAQLNFPSGIVVGPQQAVYFSDSFNGRVRKLTPQAADGPPSAIAEALVVNAASQQPGPVAPGELLTIFAAGIGPSAPAGAQMDATGALLTSIGNTQVQFDGVAAPLLLVQSGQIILQAPYSVTGSTQMEVFYQGVSRLRMTLPVAASAPGIFTDQIVNSDYSPNSLKYPAPRGSIVTIYATGEGQLTPAGVAGRPGPATPLQPLLPVSVTIGGSAAEIISVGSAPGVIGRLQVQARVPAGVTAGILPITLKVGTAGSQPGASIHVR